LNCITKRTCLYTEAIIQDVCSQALIDSGSAARILSNKLGRKIGIKNEDLQNVSHTLTAANGGNLSVFDKINLK
jgi:predicted aspartyl protease